MATIAKTILILRHDTANNWSKANPILRTGEPGYDTTNKVLKVGDGVTPWNELTISTPTNEISQSDESEATINSAYALAQQAGYNGSIDNLVDFIKDNKTHTISETEGLSWSLIRELQGAGLTSEIFSIGDDISDIYIAPDNTQYIQSWRVVDYKKVETEDGNEHDSMILMAKYAFDKVQFDAKEPSNPDGGRKNYGNGNYSLSAVRQYINSDAAAGEWWSPQHQYDAAPSNANTMPGLLAGFTEDFKSMLRPVKVVTQGNNVSGAAAENKQLYITYDKLWLPSLQELNYNIYNSNTPNKNVEGSTLSYYNQWSGNNSNKIVYQLSSKNSKQNVWLRSPGVDYSYYAFDLNSNGDICNGILYLTNGLAPLISIFK